MHTIENLIWLIVQWLLKKSKKRRIFYMKADSVCWLQVSKLIIEICFQLVYNWRLLLQLSWYIITIPSTPIVSYRRSWLRICRTWRVMNWMQPLPNLHHLQAVAHRLMACRNAWTWTTHRTAMLVKQLTLVFPSALKHLQFTEFRSLTQKPGIVVR